MNKVIRQTATRFFRLTPAIMIALFLLCPQALAAEGGAEWRSTYDTLMLWVNFFILAFVIYHYGRKPFSNFLKGQRDEISSEIEELGNRKKGFEDQILETRQMIAESSTRFEEIKSRITEEGRRKRQEIIDRAREQSRKLIEMEKKKAANQIAQARHQLIDELADSASSMAFKRLPGEMTESDQEGLLSLYIQQITEYSRQAAS